MDLSTYWVLVLKTPPQFRRPVFHLSREILEYALICLVFILYLLWIGLSIVIFNGIGRSGDQTIAYDSVSRSKSGSIFFRIYRLKMLEISSYSFISFSKRSVATCSSYVLNMFLISVKKNWKNEFLFK